MTGQHPHRRCDGIEKSFCADACAMAERGPRPTISPFRLTASSKPDCSSSSVRVPEVTPRLHRALAELETQPSSGTRGSRARFALGREDDTWSPAAVHTASLEVVADDHRSALAILLVAAKSHEAVSNAIEFLIVRACREQALLRLLTVDTG